MLAAASASTAKQPQNRNGLRCPATAMTAPAHMTATNSRVVKRRTVMPRFEAESHTAGPAAITAAAAAKNRL